MINSDEITRRPIFIVARLLRGFYAKSVRAPVSLQIFQFTRVINRPSDSSGDLLRLHSFHVLQNVVKLADAITAAAAKEVMTSG